MPILRDGAHPSSPGVAGPFAATARTAVEWPAHAGDAARLAGPRRA